MTVQKKNERIGALRDEAERAFRRYSAEHLRNALKLVSLEMRLEKHAPSELKVTT